MPCWSRSRWPAPASAGVAGLWAVSDGEKVERDDRAHPLKGGNAVWDGRVVRSGGGPQRDRRVPGDRGGGRARASARSTPRCRRCVATAAARSSTRRRSPIPSLSVGRPIQLFSVHYMNVTAESHAEWAWKPGSPAAPRDTTGWKPVQLVPENARAGPRRLPARRGPRPRTVALDRDLRRAASLPPGLYRGTLTVTADGKAAPLPVELRRLRLHAAGREQPAAMVYYEPDQPELYQGQNLDPAYHRFAHRHRVELVHAYDEAAVEARRGRFDGRDFTRERRLRRPRRGQGQHDRADLVLRPGPRLRGAAERLEALGRLDELRRPIAARRDARSSTCRTSRTRSSTPRSAASPRTSTRTRARAASCPSSSPSGSSRSSQGLIDIWCVPPQAFDIAGCGSGARGRPAGLVLQRRAPAGPDAWSSTRPRPRRASSAGPRSSTTSRSTSSGTASTGSTTARSRASASRTCGRTRSPSTTAASRGSPSTTRATSTATASCSTRAQEKVHPDEDRGIAGPIGTVQLANLRRGAAGPPVPDAGAPARARRRGERRRSSAVVPRVFSDAGETVGFAETGEAFEAAGGGSRRPLAAEAIEDRARRTTAARRSRRRPLARRSRAPRMLVAERDAFSGLPALKARWAAGERPAPTTCRAARSPRAPAGGRVVRAAARSQRCSAPIRRPAGRARAATSRYLRRALAFDWLYGYAGFDARAQGRGGQRPRGGRARHARAPVAGRSRAGLVPQPHARASWPSPSSRWSRSRGTRPSRRRRRRCAHRPGGRSTTSSRDGAREPGRRLPRVDGLHADHLGAARADGRAAADDHGRRPGARASASSATWGPPTSTRCCPTAVEARDDDNEFPHLDALDNVVLGYAVHRFKDPYAAWLLQQSGVAARGVGESRCSSSSGATRRSRRAIPRPRPRPSCRGIGSSRGIGHLVLRDGWGDGLDLDPARLRPLLREARPPRRDHFVVYHKGYLAIDAGADYTDTESPHYLNHYRRTVAHNTMLVYQPGESFFWGENRWPAANDGGQRMDSSRFWNCVGASRTSGARATSGTAVGSIRWRPSPATATRAPTRRGAYQPSKLDALHARAGAGCARPTSSSCSTASARAIPPSARPGCSTAWPSRRWKPRPRARAPATAARAIARPRSSRSRTARAGCACTRCCRASAR